jgi:hypothetical protein
VLCVVVRKVVDGIDMSPGTRMEVVCFQIAQSLLEAFVWLSTPRIPVAVAWCRCWDRSSLSLPVRSVATSLSIHGTIGPIDESEHVLLKSIA